MVGQRGVGWVSECSHVSHVTPCEPKVEMVQYIVWALEGYLSELCRRPQRHGTTSAKPILSSATIWECNVNLPRSQTTYNLSVKVPQTLGGPVCQVIIGNFLMSSKFDFAGTASQKKNHWLCKKCHKYWCCSAKMLSWL